MTELPLKKYYRWMFLPGVLLLLVPSILHAYFLMPFPGSQDIEAMNLSYYIEKFLWPTRILALALIALPILNIYMNGRLKGRIWTSVLIVFMAGLLYFTEIFSSAEHMFLEPKQKTFASASTNAVPLDRLIIGVSINGEAKAYPINFIGYHHKVQDSVGGKPILVTYCTMCRTGRVYDPFIDGKYQHFRLVGARHYDAIIEDNETGSWWYQATGTAAVGPRKGIAMGEIPCEQMTLGEWISLHPNTLIMQPDPNFKARYKRLEPYDSYQPTKTDAASELLGWQRASWVIGVISGNTAKAYRWNDVLPLHIVNDQIGTTPVVVMIGSDSTSFACYKSTVAGEVLHLRADSLGKGYRDEHNDLWNVHGDCVEGILQGKKLDRIPAYQEYWHAWHRFHPETAQWKS
ncbi:MAG: DUF3179 domain-containing (seleno)protein [Bacteroidota bacterium]|nr:DUF3179 domain-containing (seleno)protein [Bacteroidota bacterium]MDP4229272.1 DUF3179 domain-containing (seleno)protein [Bacteroidota bacterium]MDP4235791.1 DUF3179 domain-containing (seleno)protein [Bacteroidota bacterium]